MPEETSAEVLIQNEDAPPAPPAVPVDVRNVVRVDEMPTRLGAARSFIVATGDDARKVLNGDRARKRVILWALALGTGIDAVCVAKTQGEAQAFEGAMLSVATVPLRYEFTFTDELWARGCVINDNTGSWAGNAVATDDAVLSLVVERWTD